MVELELELRKYGITNCGHFYISKVLIDQNILELGKRYKLKIEEARD